MKIVIISPEGDAPREHTVLAALCSAGLERYHVRKPGWPREQLAAWLAGVPVIWRQCLVLHQHHALAAEFGCGGVHCKDGHAVSEMAQGGTLFRSHACHDLAALESSLGRFDSVFFSPVFPSISKPGYGPATALGAVTEILRRRTVAERRTSVIALGGIVPANVGRCAELGFDGVAVLGALWSAPDPLAVFEQFCAARRSHAA